MRPILLVLILLLFFSVAYAADINTKNLRNSVPYSPPRYEGSIDKNTYQSDIDVDKNPYRMEIKKDAFSSYNELNELNRDVSREGDGYIRNKPLPGQRFNGKHKEQILYEARPKYNTGIKKAAHKSPEKDAPLRVNRQLYLFPLYCSLFFIIGLLFRELNKEDEDQ